MVRLQKRFAYKYKDKEHYKYVVTLPEDTINKVGLKEGDELLPSVQGDRIVLSHVKRATKRKGE